jgi:PhnB protein
MSLTATQVLQPIPYLHFDGTCLDAMRFYERTFGGTLLISTTYGETPFADQMPPEYRSRIVNARFEMPGGPLLYAGDVPPHITYTAASMSIALNFDSTDEAVSVFNALAEGGQITMPIAPTFWAKMFGMVDDKFGTSWIINGELLPM